MRDIPAQLNAIRKTTIGDIILSFRVDELYAESVQELFIKKVGTEFVMKLEDVTSSTMLDTEGESSDSTKEKFFRQLRAKMREYEEISKNSDKEVKTRLLIALSKRGIEIESTKELGIKELAIAIGVIDNWLKNI